MSTPASDDIERSKAVAARKLPNNVTQFKEIKSSEFELVKHNETYIGRFDNGQILFSSRQLQGDDSKRSYFIFDGKDLAGIRTGSDGNSDSLLALMKENPNKKLYIRCLPPPVAGKKEVRFFIKEVAEVAEAALNQQNMHVEVNEILKLMGGAVEGGENLKTMGRGELETVFERFGLDKSLVTIVPDLDFEGNHALHLSYSDGVISFRTLIGETTYYPSLFIYNLFTFWASQVDWSVEDSDTRKWNEMIMSVMEKFFEMSENVMVSKEQIDESTSVVYKAIAESRNFTKTESKELFGIAQGDQTITFKQYQDILKKRKLPKVDLRPLGLPENAKEIPAWMGYLGIKIGFAKQFLRFNANQEAVRNVMTRCLKYVAPIERWVEVEEFLVAHFSKNTENEESGGGEEEENSVVAVSHFQKKADEAEKRRLEVLRKKALKKGKPLKPAQKPAQQKQSQIPEIAQCVMNNYIRNNKGQRIEAHDVSTKFGELTVVEVDEPEPVKVVKEKSLCHQLGYHEDWSQKERGKDYESNFHHVPLEYRKRHNVKYFLMEKRDMGRPLKSQYLTDLRTYVKSYNIKQVPIRIFKSENREKEDNLFFTEDVYDMIECYIDKNTNARLCLFLDEHNQEKRNNIYATVTLNRFSRLMSAFNIDMSKFVAMPDVYRDLTTGRSEIEFFAPIRTLGPDGEIVMNVKQAIFSTFQQVVIGINWIKAEEDLGTENIKLFKEKYFEVMEEYENTDNAYFISQQHVDQNIQKLQNDEIYQKLSKNVPNCFEKGQDINQKVDMPVIALNCMAYSLPVTDSSSTIVNLPVHWYHLVFGWIMTFYKDQKSNQQRILAERMCVKAQVNCEKLDIHVHKEWVEKWIKKDSETSGESSGKYSEDSEDSDESKHTHCGACCKPLSERPEPETPPQKAPEASKPKLPATIPEVPPAKKPTVVAKTSKAPHLSSNEATPIEHLNDAKYWRDKCFTAGEHCSEAQKAQKSAEKKAKEYETKAKRTEEVEKEMKKMKKEMEKLKEKSEKMMQELEEANETLQKKKEKEMKLREELKSEKQRANSLEEKNQILEEAFASLQFQPSTSGPSNYKIRLEELIKKKDDFEERLLRTQAMKMANVLTTESDDPDIKKMVDEEMDIFMKSYDEYLKVLLQNIFNLKKFLGTRPLIPLPTEPAISEKLYKAYRDHTGHSKALVEDYECHLCFVRPAPTEKTVHCGHAKCKKLMHFKCAKEWYTNNTTSTACMYCKEPFMNIKAVKQG
ncbi:hypothetical protein GCK72_011715 [Caenorhabditis remanei]|uniref:RING-type domain-containing protein n=1 Tax=Caenorhabditis remanei TaxID=31234 RepID=A0A6A5H8T3_CAERE|nr:hypothetical protein GCK72_011715 [Caenorhabditis remanei]KAF1763449.1 hypothetical protein GCK72_011715 [Caenorhabditis remanei]